MTLDQDNEIRQFVIEEYFNKELHFVLAPTQRPYFYSSSLSEIFRDFIVFRSYFQIKQFLDENPDLRPKKVLIVSGGGDFGSMKALLGEFEEWFKNGSVGAIEITLENYDMSSTDFNYLLGFNNLSRIHFSNNPLINMKRGLILNEKLANHPNLENIVFLKHEISEWKGVMLPKKLRCLDIAWNPQTDLSTLIIPDTVKELYFNQCNINDSGRVMKSLPALNLSVLMLAHNFFSTLELSYLPRTLMALDLTYNSISCIEDQTGNGWPPMLENISLANNMLDDLALDGMLANQIYWPQRLEILTVEGNKIKTFSKLGELPESLEILDLSQNNAASFLQENNGEVASEGYFKFPSKLRILGLECCSGLNQVNNLENLRKYGRIRFPEGLTELNLSECNLSSLHGIQFPNSLKSLALSGNRLRELCSYNSPGVNWTQLVNLSELELFSNGISGLEEWEPPIKLTRLDLRENCLESISSKFPLFDRFYNAKMTRFTHLDLGYCWIESFDPNVRLPPNLIYLSLCNNSFKGPIFIPDAFKAVQTLDLSENEITSIQIIDTDDGDISNRLNSLDLSNNRLLKNHRKNMKFANEFYDRLEQMLGLKVKTRRFNVNSLLQLE
ncbi:uncharacterized protein J8A68_001710 [[Candida] subhashii]|uniref:Uncharacterized protein n=1 Tax=[Candida] subhashii TaxID=561895 RepID=A0A8J5QQH4_9ASCO|nr:uncharacterized protein J8A68_001710 [[Candida] subhashii]KAG7664755.1 hypothetical protein J8A68_001710 [[Candida] subhashii]